MTFVPPPPQPYFVFIASKLNGNVIDIEQASAANGALLDAWPQKQSGHDNQLWNIVQDPAGSDYFFLQSRLNGNVIDILGASNQNGTLLDAWPQKQNGTDNQLWKFLPDPGGSGFFLIQSKLNGNVIDILGGSSANGARLDAWPQKQSGTVNQLWKIVPLQYSQALFEFWTTDDDLRQDSSLSAVFFAPQQQVIDPPPPVPVTGSLTVKAFNAPKLDNGTHASLPVQLVPPLDPTQFLTPMQNPTQTQLLDSLVNALNPNPPFPPIPTVLGAQCQLTLGQHGTGFGESSDEWHVGAIRITLQNPETTEQRLIYGGDVGSNPPTKWIFNKSDPTQALPLSSLGS
jgi:hypothetical protein